MEPNEQFILTDLCLIILEYLLLLINKITISYPINQ